jgi:hypothetical protein
MLLSTLRTLSKEEEERAGGGGAEPKQVVQGDAEVEGTSIMITGATGN